MTLAPTRALAAAGLAALLAVGAAGVRSTGRGPVTAELVDPRDPAVVLDREITATFGLARPVVWIVEARDGSIWTPAMLARVQAVTRDVFRIPGVLAPDVVSIASPNLRDLVVSEAGMRPTYLMGEVPQTPEAVAALRARVDGDPMLRGQLVDVAGHAAMIVANFRDGVPGADIAQAALALRDRHRDGQAAVWVVGEPVLAEVAGAAAPRLLGRVVLPVLACVLLGCVVLLGWRRTSAALVAAVTAGLGTVALASWTGTLVLPWTAVAALTGMLLAAALVAAARVDWRPVCGAALGTLVGLGAGAALAPGAERALADGLLVAIPLGGLAALGARVAFGLAATVVPVRRRRRIALAVVAAILAVGATQLRPGFALAGYGQRYLPASVAPDLGAMARLFPPPQSLALRVRGAPGFVASPAVLHALEAVAGAAAADPKVRHAMSIADLVKIVNRSFHEGRSEFAVVPDDRGMIARYLALAYSPGFRRFVDRALDAAALWITIDGAGPGDLRRIEARVDRALAARPVPDATVDRFGGDGAVTLAMAASGRRVAIGAAGVLALALLGVLVAGGPARAARALAASALAGIAMAGLLGWCGQALDLVTVPLLAGVVLAAVVAGGRGRPAARG